jgi:hypothetical protein
MHAHVNERDRVSSEQVAVADNLICGAERDAAGPVPAWNVKPGLSQPARYTRRRRRWGLGRASALGIDRKGSEDAYVQRGIDRRTLAS